MPRPGDAFKIATESLSKFGECFKKLSHSHINIPIDQAVKNLVGESEKILAESEEMLDSLGSLPKLEAPPDHPFGPGTKTHNYMMYVYHGNIPASVSWAEIMFKENVEFRAIATFTRDYLKKLQKSCEAASSIRVKSCPSIRTFAEYLKRGIDHHLSNNPIPIYNPQPPPIPTGTPIMTKFYQQAQAGYVPADGVWTDRFYEDVELVLISNLDPRYINRMTEDVVKVLALEDHPANNIYNYAKYLSKILQFHVENPDYYYNLESD